MKRILTLAIMACFLFANLALAAERGTAAECQAMVEKALDFLKANGKDKAFEEFSNPAGKFVDRDLYIFAYDLNGLCLAHGANKKMVGKDLLELKDPSGKQIVKELIDMARANGRGWVDYRWTDPVTKAVQDKRGYVALYEDIIVGSGIYK